MTELKPKIVGIKRDDSLLSRVELICFLKFSILPAAEISVLCRLIEYSTNNTLTLTVDIGKMVRIDAGVGGSAFSTALFRLEKRGVISRGGKTVIIHPIFKDIAQIDKVLVSFS